MPADRIALIPMGADTRMFRRDPAARRKVRDELGWGETDIVVTFAGKVQRRKGVHLLIEAALLSLSQHPDLKFLIVGGGEDDYVAAMQQTIASAGWSDAFRWVGMIPNRELYRFYSASDISVWPEQVSIGTFEAQACGLPLIVADAPVLRERVQPDTGYLYKPGDIHDLSAKINSLALDEQLRTALGAAGRRHIETSHSWRAIAQQFIDLVGP
jgi:glycosyltransferase involved in cell wall biosynthesis